MSAATALCLLPAATSRAAPEIDALIAQLARPAPAVTRFVEVRFSTLLAKPLVVSGELEYLGPGFLARVVQTPFRERAEIRGESVLVTREGQKPRRFSLRRVTELNMLIASFAALLSGDGAALERVFTLDLERQADEWQLAMTPRDARTRQHIARIALTGRGAEVRCLTMTEPDADASILLLGAAPDTKLPEPIERPWLESFCDGARDPGPAG